MTAYWLVYISEATLNDYKKVNINDYAPGSENREGHVYASMVTEEVSKHIDEENANLLALIQDNKNLELAKQVIALYDARYKELMKLFPSDKPEAGADLASIFSYLMNKNCRDSVARLILGFALKECVGAVSDQNLLTKIEQQL